MERSDRVIAILAEVHSDEEAQIVLEQFQELIGSAMEASRRTDWPETARLLSEAALLADLPPYLRTHLAEAWCWTGEPSKAVTEYETALQEDPEDPRAWENLAVALLQVGRYVDARVAALEAVRRAPESAFAWLNLGVAERKVGLYADGRRSFENAARLDAGLFTAWKNLGNACRDAKEWNAAEAAYRKALAIDHFRRDVWSDLANVLDRQGRVDAAHAAFRQGVHIHPGDPDAWVDLIGFCWKNDLMAEARMGYRHLLELSPLWAKRLCIQLADVCKEASEAKKAAWGTDAPVTDPTFWDWAFRRSDPLQ